MKYGFIFLITFLLSCNKKEVSDNLTSDPREWAELGGNNKSSFNGQIRKIVVDSKNNLYAIGEFTNPIDGYAYVAMWNGFDWIKLPNNPLFLGAAYIDIIVDNNDQLYTAIMSGYNGNYVLKWNGISWVKLGGSFNDGVFKLVSDQNGNIYAGGAFSLSINKRSLAKWDGVSWMEVGSNSSPFNNPNLFIKNIFLDKNGNVYVGPMVTNTNAALAKWNGSTWREFGGTTLYQNQCDMAVFVDSKDNFLVLAIFQILKVIIM